LAASVAFQLMEPKAGMCQVLRPNGILQCGQHSADSRDMIDVQVAGVVILGKST